MFTPESKFVRKALGQAVLIAGIYAVLGILWIYFSDAALEAMVVDVAHMRILQPWKGTLFVLTSSLLIFGLIWNALSRQQRLLAKVRSTAFNHPLTGLPNRIGATRLLNKIMKSEGELPAGYVLARLDIDRFGMINESFGHEIGDSLLVSVANRLRDRLPDGVIVAHTDADEFLVIARLADLTEDADTIIEIIEESFSDPFVFDQSREVHLSACVGIACFPIDSTQADELVRYADAAVSRAKRAGPGSIVRFDDEMITQARERLRMDARLRDAISKNEFSLHYQPIVGERAGRDVIQGVEALLRWHPVGGESVPPDQFVPIAEDTGLIIQIGDWVIEKACAQLSHWRQKGWTDLTMSVNLSARQVEAGGLVAVVSAALERYQLPSGILVLELTESLLMEQGTVGRELMDQLHALGVRLALDDFGTGYCSLSYLKDLPVDLIKIDRAFIGELRESGAERDLVAAMVGLAQIFSLDVIAEGVETQSQREILQGLQCRTFQGYLFSRPLPAEELEALLGNF